MNTRAFLLATTVLAATCGAQRATASTTLDFSAAQPLGASAHEMTLARDGGRSGGGGGNSGGSNGSGGNNKGDKDHDKGKENEKENEPAHDADDAPGHTWNVSPGDATVNLAAYYGGGSKSGGSGGKHNSPDGAGHA